MLHSVLHFFKYVFVSFNFNGFFSNPSGFFFVQQSVTPPSDCCGLNVVFCRILVIGDLFLFLSEVFEFVCFSIIVTLLVSLF